MTDSIHRFFPSVPKVHRLRMLVLLSCALNAPANAATSPPSPSPAPGSAGDSVPAQAGPRLQVPALRKDVGEVTAGESVETEFPLRNSGSGLLKIEQVIPSCHCTTTSCPETLQPGESGVLKVKVATYALSTGELDKQVTVVSNDPDATRLELHVIAHLRPLFRFEPRNPLSVSYKKGEVIRRVFTITPAEGSSVRVMGVVPGGPETQARLLPAESAAASAGWRVEVTVRPPESGGDFTSAVMLQTTHPAVSELPITIFAVCEDGISISPPRLYLSQLRAGPLPPVTLYKRGGPFRVLEVQPDSPALQATVSDPPIGSGTATESNFCTITLRYLGGWEKGARSGKIVVVTNDPISPRVEVPYVAMVE